MKYFLTALLLISFVLGCSKSEIDRANEIYKRTSFQNKLNNSSTGLDDAIAILTNLLEKEPNNLNAKILLWKCYVKSDNPKREVLYSELVKLDQRLISKLESHLQDKDEIVRQRIVDLLGDLNNTSAVPTLIDVLKKDEYKNVQQAAAEALAKSRDKRAIPALLEKLESSNPLVRYYAVSALGSFNDDNIIEQLLDIMSDPEEASDVKHQAALSLSQIKNQAAEPTLLKIFNSQNQSAQNKLLAALTLGSLGNPIGFRLALESAKRDDVYLVGLALEALGRIQDERALPILIENLKYGNKALRALAAEALGYLGDPKAIPALEQALNDPISGVQNSARVALSKLNNASQNR